MWYDVMLMFVVCMIFDIVKEWLGNVVNRFSIFVDWDVERVGCVIL